MATRRERNGKGLLVVRRNAGGSARKAVFLRQNAWPINPMRIRFLRSPFGGDFPDTFPSSRVERFGLDRRSF